MRVVAGARDERGDVGRAVRVVTGARDERGGGGRAMSMAMTVAVHLLGVAAFTWPFFARALSGGGRAAAHAGDAPLLFTALGTLLVALAVAEVRTGRMTTKHLAMLGVLAGVNAILRLPGAFAGASLMFVLPIAAGAAFGARFAFLLGALSMAASGVITGGVGPWLPFQMWALGWVGAGAAFVSPRGGSLRRLPGRRGLGPGAQDRDIERVPEDRSHLGFRRGGVIVLAVYAWIAGMVFGALVNLWFWPFQSGDAAVSWHPGLGAGETAVRYWRFYLLTSLAWDASRALGNAVLVLALGRPLVRTLSRFRARVEVRWDARDGGARDAGARDAGARDPGGAGARDPGGAGARDAQGAATSTMGA